MSNEPTTTEMNKTICEFMGWEFKEDGPDWFKAYRDGMIQWADTKKGLDHILVEGFKYHSSWDWLMPVVEKIETPQFDKDGKFIALTSADVQILYKACIIEYEPDEESGDTNDEIKIQTTGETKLEAVYKAVYQFIQWFNQQSNEQPGG